MHAAGLERGKSVLQRELMGSDVLWNGLDALCLEALPLFHLSLDVLCLEARSLSSFVFRLSSLSSFVERRKMKDETKDKRRKTKDERRRLSPFVFRLSSLWHTLHMCNIAMLHLPCCIFHVASSMCLTSTGHAAHCKAHLYKAHIYKVHISRLDAAHVNACGRRVW